MSTPVRIIGFEVGGPSVDEPHERIPMDTMTGAEAEAGRALTRSWWLFLVTGIAWVVLAFVVLSWDPTTPALIGFLTGLVLIAAGVNEAVTIAFVDGWKWLHGVLAALFVVAGFLALLAPFQTFGILALLIGWYLLFKGLADVIFSIVERDALHLWGLLLASGIIEMAIGIWAIGYPGRSAWLLILWVGIGALIRGITEIVLAFKLRHEREHPSGTFAVA
jgi:uncharacterized membrane protein HdeD (DUF308 family)